MGIHSVEKRQLSAKGLLNRVHSIFNQIPPSDRDPRGLKSKILLADCLMSALAQQLRVIYFLDKKMNY